MALFVTSGGMYLGLLKILPAQSLKLSRTMLAVRAGALAQNK